MAVYPNVELLSRSVITISIQELCHSPACQSSLVHRVGGSDSTSETVSSGVAVPVSSSSVQSARESALASVQQGPIASDGDNEFGDANDEEHQQVSEASRGSRSLLLRLYRRIAEHVHVRRRAQSTDSTRRSSVVSSTPDTQVNTLLSYTNESYVRTQWNTESVQQRHHRQIALQSQRRASQGISRIRRGGSHRVELMATPQLPNTVPMLSTVGLVEAMSPVQTLHTCPMDKEVLSIHSEDVQDDTVSTRRRTFRHTLGRARDLYKMLGRFEEFFSAEQSDMVIRLDSTPPHEQMSLLSSPCL